MSVHWSKKRVSELQNCVETCHELLSCRDTTVELLFQGAEVLDAAAPGCVVVVGRLTAARDGAAFSGCSVVFEDWWLWPPAMLEPILTDGAVNCEKRGSSPRHLYTTFVTTVPVRI